MEALESRLAPAVTPAPVLDLSGLSTDTTVYDPSHLLVRFQPGAAPGFHLDGLRVGTALPLVPDLYTVELSAGWTVDTALTALSGNPLVASAQPDYTLRVQLTPNDTSFGQQWALNNTGQGGGVAGADIGATAAWGVTTGTGRITVGVIDSGIDYNHSDLVPNLWINQAEIPAQWYAGPGLSTVVHRTDLVDVDGDGKISFRDLTAGTNAGRLNDANGDGRLDGGDLLAPIAQGGWADNTDAEANGYRDDLLGWNFAAGTNNPMDDNGHGTHVAGTIGAASNNGAGVAGVAWNARLMALKFIDSTGSGPTSAAIQALNYAVTMGAKVSNNSWGSGNYDAALYMAIHNAQSRGHVFVAAAGNDGSNNDAAPVYPASFGIANIVPVAATDQGDNLASYSNYGATTVALAAPGTGIYSTAPGNSYALSSGTSMAAPHVAGTIALLWDHHPDWTSSQVISRVLASVDPLASLAGKVVTGGRLNVATALGAPSTPVAPVPLPVAPPPPAPAAPAADSREVNDTRAGATNLGKLSGASVTGLTLHTATDADYFRFTVAKSASYTITATPTQGSGTLALTVLSSSGAVLGGGESSSGAAGVTRSFQTNATYYVRVNSSTRSLFGYTLAITRVAGNGRSGVSDVSGPPPAADRREHAPAPPTPAGTLLPPSLARIPSAFWLSPVSAVPAAALSLNSRSEVGARAPIPVPVALTPSPETSLANAVGREASRARSSARPDWADALDDLTLFVG